MVVGDDSQSIYAFRGANYDNILRFPERNAGTEVFKLETNYRSTPQILELTNASIHNNTEQRIGSGADDRLAHNRLGPHRIRNGLGNRPQGRVVGPGDRLFGGCVGYFHGSRVLRHTRTYSPVLIPSWRVRMPCMSDCGPGGQPGTYTSTGTTWSTPCTSA